MGRNTIQCVDRAGIECTTSGGNHQRIGIEIFRLVRRSYPGYRHAWPDADLDRVRMDWRDLADRNVHLSDLAVGRGSPRFLPMRWTIAGSGSLAW